ncbi:hypothetical protein ACFXJ8_12440 [Nonomuraea sp. NPDC059194]|uniref:hypothetical protein n=1 Tax=Nonomuraea sp. NPDC059194 TaxID=3346764 RepID=UPI0036A02F18
MVTVPVGVAGFSATADARLLPADTLKRQLVENRGVTMSKSFTAMKGRKRVHFWTKGTAEFGTGKIVATDLMYRSDLKYLTRPIRKIVFGGREYVRDSATRKGKHWTLNEDKKIQPSLDADWIKLADPVMLKAVLATTRVKRPAGVYEGTRTTLCQGEITVGRLERAAPGSFSGFDVRTDVRTKVSWRLWLGEDQLVRRLRGSWKGQHSGGSARRFSYIVDVRLTGWGAENDIMPPSADDVVASDAGRE